jgi:hypothetical protein
MDDRYWRHRRGKLDDQADKTGREAIEEARMVLPGIQALFGFQLIAVFNERFKELTEDERLIHFSATVLVTIAIALIMTPAAYHRLAEQTTISRFFVSLASWLIAAAMVPNLKRRGLAMGPELAVADGALGFWQAVEEVWPNELRSSSRKLKPLPPDPFRHQSVIARVAPAPSHHEIAHGQARPSCRAPHDETGVNPAESERIG